MGRVETAGTLADTAYEQILASMFDKGTFHSPVLTVVDVAARLGMSRTPVRMALTRLESEGLLERKSSRGWSRVRIRLQDVEKIFDIKEALDPLLVRKAAQRCTPEQRVELRALIGEMDQVVQSGDVHAWTDLQSRYHELMFRIADARQLGGALSRLNNQLHHIAAAHAAIRGRMAASDLEHRAVAEAVGAGDAARASRLALLHLKRIRKSIVEVVKTVLIGLVGEDL